MDSRRSACAPLGATLVIALFVPFVATVLADRAASDQADALFHQVMSPFCPGLLLANCPSPAAEALRRDIREALTRGDTPGAVEARLYAEFGDRIRAEPPAAGIGLLAWIVPVGMLVFTTLWLAAWLRRVRPPTDPRVAATASEPPSRAQLERLDEELSAL